MNINLARNNVTDRFTEFAPLSTAAADYDIVRRAIAHIRGNWRAQPEIDVIANAAGVSATDLHHLFRRWCGLTPKAFLQALTLNHARELLRSSASVLDTAYEVGLSGPGRLHDLFVTHEAMSPGEWKAGGEGLIITYGFHPCPFGMALVMTTPRGLAGLALADAGKERAALRDMKSRWPKAKYVEDFASTAPTARRIFDAALWRRPCGSSTAGSRWTAISRRVNPPATPSTVRGVLNWKGCGTFADTEPSPFSCDHVAATLSASYGIYGPALAEGDAAKPQFAAYAVLGSLALHAL